MQVVKFSLKKRVNFTEGWSTVEWDMGDNDVDDGPDLLHDLLMGVKDGSGSDKVMAVISADDEDTCQM